ncbi:MAG: hypothetical protein OEZ34_01800 [Spirochaetia bacterium]|nr:hypothetical protein [Spirochaetia bacterium]
MPPIDKNKALRILELSEDFSKDQLIRSFRKKLFENHPDTAENKNSDVSVDDLLLSRKFLEEYLNETQKQPSRRPDEKEDDGYRDYREGMKILGSALDAYWKKRVQFSHRPEGADFIKQFHEELNRARDYFIRVLEIYPGGLWTPDAVEEIARINDWLGTEENP